MDALRPTPTIKGIFVKSHINAVVKSKGQAGLEALRRRSAQSLDFRNNDNVPIPEEVKIIDLALAIMTDDHVPAEKDFEAGRLHFRNFLTTPLAKFLFFAFRTRFKTVMMKSHNIASHVFQGMTFAATDLGPTSVKVSTDNNDYPPSHFRGFLFEWLMFSGLKGQVLERQTAPRSFEYTIRWQP